MPLRKNDKAVERTAGVMRHLSHVLHVSGRHLPMGLHGHTL